MLHLSKTAFLSSSRLYRSPLFKIGLASTCMLLLLLLSACQSAITPSSVTVTADSVQQTTSVDAAARTFPVKVYFSKFPDSLNNFSKVFPVDRISPTNEVATFSIQLLIAGPTLTERSKGYFSELNSLFTGPSVCSAPHPVGGPDFTIALNKKGKVSERGTATLQFCRPSASAGIGMDARIQAEINATLLQFASIKKVVILTKDGHCFGDGSGLDRCLK